MIKKITGMKVFPELPIKQFQEEKKREVTDKINKENSNR